MTSANCSLEAIKSTACQYGNQALEVGSQIYLQAKVEGGRAFRYLGQKASEVYSYLSTKISEFAQRAFEFISNKYQELKGDLAPKINQCKQYVAAHYQNLKNDLTRLLDGRSFEHFKNATPEVKSDILLKTAAAVFIGGLLAGALGSITAGSIAFAKLAK